jgi:hypothetical protein
MVPLVVVMLSIRRLSNDVRFALLECRAGASVGRIDKTDKLVCALRARVQLELFVGHFGHQALAARGSARTIVARKTVAAAAAAASADSGGEGR